MRVNPPDPLASTKAEIRRELRQRRDALAADRRAEASTAIRTRLLELPALRQAQIVFCFLSTSAEVATPALIDALRAMGKTILAPKILPGQPMRAVTFSGWADLVTGPLGIAAPPRDEAYTGRVDVVITPGLGFTIAGDRIGYGRGYYDRWFATHTHGLRVGVAFECQLADALPMDRNDVRVHMLVTELRTATMPQAEAPH